MKLIKITIENFRGIKYLSMPLTDLTVLYGENNTGKSTILDAIRMGFPKGF
jgi:putative ATP-dependent endonuclease of OLD family